jgi:hypothetical protein
MDALLVLTLLCALGPLALHFGYDSRDRLRSAEHDLARQGFAWGPLPRATPGRTRPDGPAERAVGRVALPTS